MTLPIIAELRFPWQLDSPQIGGDGNFCIFDEVVETDRERRCSTISATRIHRPLNRCGEVWVGRQKITILAMIVLQPVLVPGITIVFAPSPNYSFQSLIIGDRISISH